MVLLFQWGCKSRPVNNEQSNPEIDFRTVLQQLPDSLKNLSADFQPEWELDAIQVDALLSKGDFSPSEFMSFEIVEGDRESGLLKVESRGTDNGLAYQFLLLNSDKGLQQVVIERQVADMCCEYSKVGIYSLSDGQLLDRTGETLPMVGMVDFIPSEFIPKTLLEESYPLGLPFQMDLEENPARILIQLNPEYLSLNFSEQDARLMLENLKKEKLVLTWDKGKSRFVK